MRKVAKSAVSGRFVTAKYAKTHKRTMYWHTIRKQLWWFRANRQKIKTLT